MDCMGSYLRDCPFFRKFRLLGTDSSWIASRDLLLNRSSLEKGFMSSMELDVLLRAQTVSALFGNACLLDFFWTDSNVLFSISLHFLKSS